MSRRSKAAPIEKVRYVPAQRRFFKKENKRIRPDRTCLLQKYVPYTKSTSHFGIVWNWNRWSVFEPSAIAVNIRKNLAITRGGHNISRTSRYTPSLPLPAPEFRQRRELRGPQPTRDWWKKFASPEEVKLVVERETI